MAGPYRAEGAVMAVEKAGAAGVTAAMAPAIVTATNSAFIRHRSILPTPSTSPSCSTLGDRERLLPGLPAATALRLDVLRARCGVHRDRDLRSERPRPVGHDHPESRRAHDGVDESENDLLVPAEARPLNRHDGA